MPAGAEDGSGVGDVDGSPDVVGAGLAVSVADGEGVGDSLVHSSGAVVGSSGGTDDSTIGPLTSGDGDDVGAAVAHGCALGGIVGDAGLEAGCPCGTTTETPGDFLWCGPAVVLTEGVGELAGGRTVSLGPALTACEIPRPPSTAAVTAAAPDIAIVPCRRARIRRPR